MRALAARDKHIPFQLGGDTLSLDDVQHLIGLSADDGVPITEGSWSLTKLVEIFKKNLCQDEDFYNSMKTEGQGNSLSLVKLVNFYVGKLEKYNNSIQNERPVGYKKNAMSALFVARTYMLYVLGTFLLPVKKGSYLPGIPKEQHSDATEYCTRWKWGLSITDRTGARELLKYREEFDNYKAEDVKIVWDPYKAEKMFDYDFNENTFFNGLTSSQDHVDPIYPNRVVRQFVGIQPIPKNPKCVEVSRLRTRDGDEPKQYKPNYDWVDVFLMGLLKEWIVRSRDSGRRLRGPAQCIVGYMQWFLSVSWTKICPPTVDLSADDDIGLSACHPIRWTKECQVLNMESTKLVEDMRIKTGVDASNASLAIELAKQRREYKLLQDINAKLAEQSERQHPEPVPLAVILKGVAVPSRDLQKKIDELTVKYEDVVKRLKEKESFRSQLIIVEEMKKKLEVEHYEWEAWCQAMKKEFYSEELAEKDNPTFIEQFDQYDRFYTIAQQRPKGDYQEDFIVTGGNQEKLMDVRMANVVMKKKINETLFQLYVKYHLDVRGVQGEDGNSVFRVPATIKHQS
ncbi:hypothetical protein GIB67_030875 [Kingdonia uniflora]|uniref:Uncharacterized protein n=1 Tax=Kingdonia uniflora TaxID=39325 RepID=A0A7J7L3A8_9MAGN|nr:hypothetical protein GIB67_030875 [Kingdonia uniflora]